VCSQSRLGTCCLLRHFGQLLRTHGRSVFPFHLLVQSFSLVEYLQQFFVDCVAVELLEDVVLMSLLILRLSCLFSPLLLLNHLKRVLRLIFLNRFLLDVLALTRCSFGLLILNYLSFLNALLLNLRFRWLNVKTLRTSCSRRS